MPVARDVLLRHRVSGLRQTITCRAATALRFPAEADRPLVEVVRRLPKIEQPARIDPALFTRAEHHGLAGVLQHAWRAAGLELPPKLAVELEARAVARELEHAAHLALLSRIGSTLAADRVAAVVLKGPLFAERLYPHPSARGSSDIDLLVEEHRLEDARRALRSVGYTTPDGGYDAASRRYHHHVTLVHPHALPLELHFQAYIGFGERLPGGPILARAGDAGARFGGLQIPAPADELVYLAVHAAAHRFGRLAWLHDLRLLAETMPPGEIALAAERAREHGYSRVLMLAGALLVDLCGVPNERLAALGELGPLREPMIRAMIGEPRSPALRSATRFAYTTLLGQSAASALRYARRASLGHARRALGRPR